jgi:hypothetical protein
MPSRLYNYFLMSWRYGRITQEQLQTAVQKGYITQEEYEQIIATPQDMVASAETTG